jgi:hypothetical protein
VTAGNKKALAANKTSATSVIFLEQPSGFGGEVRTSRDSLQIHVSKRKAEELSSSDSPPEPASGRPAPGHVLGDGPEAQGKTGEQATQCSRQVAPTEGGLDYTIRVAKGTACNSKACRTSPQPRVHIRLKPLPHLRQLLGACLSDTCPVLCEMP